METTASATYFRVRLSQVPDSLEDVITTLSFEHGASGVSEALAFSQPDLTYDPRLIPMKARDLDVFFANNPPREYFIQLRDLAPNVRCETNEEESKDWLAEWKKGFKPFQLIGPYWVVPSWEEVPPECQFPLRIDPGMAFGTGTHATTQMMAFFIHKLTEKHKNQIADWSLLDVGTGTAILAMLARKAGFPLVTGIEIDSEARRTARVNIELNQLNDIEIRNDLIEDLSSAYHVVVANIIDGVLIQLQKELLRVTTPGGYLLVTGILKERDDEFFQSFIEKAPLKVIRRLEKNEWVGYWLERKSE